MKPSDKKSKILHLTSVFEVGGQQKIISDIVHIDDFNEHYLTILRRSTEALAFFKKRIPVLFYKGLGDEEIINKLKDFIAEESIDIILAHNRLAWDIAVEIYKSVPVCIYFVAHSIDLNRKNESDPERIFKLHSNSVYTEKLICTSEFLKKEYSGLMPEVKEKIIRIYNGIRIINSENKLIKQNIRDSLELKNDSILIGMIARLAKIKNQGFLIETIFELVKAGEKNFKLVIVGDGPEQEVLLSRIREYNLEGFVILKENSFSINDFYESFDIFVNCSLFESCSISILEAMSHGLPVIATDVGGNKELVIDNETGFLFPLNNKESFIEKLKMLFNDAELRNKLGDNGRRRIVDNFNIQNTVKCYQELFSSSFEKTKRKFMILEKN